MSSKRQKSEIENSRSERVIQHKFSSEVELEGGMNSFALSKKGKKKNEKLKPLSSVKRIKTHTKPDNIMVKKE